MPPIKSEKRAKAHIPKQHSPGSVEEHMMLFNMHAPGGPYIYESPKRKAAATRKNSVARALKFDNNKPKNSLARKLFGGKRRKTHRRR